MTDTICDWFVMYFLEVFKECSLQKTVMEWCSVWTQVACGLATATVTQLVADTESRNCDVIMNPLAKYMLYCHF